MKVASLHSPEARPARKLFLNPDAGVPRDGKYCTALSSVVSQHYSRIRVVSWRETSCVTGKQLILSLLLIQFCLEFAVEVRDCGMCWMFKGRTSTG